MSKKITDDDIRVAAYFIWEQAGKPCGAEIECWLQACEQVLGKKSPAKKAEKTAAPKKTAKVAKPAEKPASKAPAPKAATTPFYGIKK